MFEMGSGMLPTATGWAARAQGRPEQIVVTKVGLGGGQQMGSNRPP
jgi:hypothetical protein